MSAPPIVALHGLLGGPGVFDALAARLAGRHVHALTLPGHGAAPSAVPTDFPTAAARLQALIDERIGAQTFDLVGYSLGARLALALLAQRPARIRRVVLISVSPGLTSETARLARRTEDEAAATLVEREGLPAFITAWEARPLFASQRSLTATLQDAQRRLRSSHAPASIATLLRQLGLAEMPDYRAVLREQAARISLLVGEHDEKFRHIARELVATCPGLVVEIIPASGHNPLLEAPGPTAARIEALLATPSASHPSAPVDKEHRS